MKYIALLLVGLTATAVGLNTKRRLVSYMPAEAAEGLDAEWNKEDQSEWDQAIRKMQKRAVDREEVSFGKQKKKHKKAGKANMCIDGHVAPEFFLLGAQKAASSTFAAKFFASPSVIMPKKEIHFFDRRKDAPASEYLKKFPECRNDVRLVGADCTPAYLTHPGVPEQIKELYGNSFDQIKFTILLRNPVKRMHSGYYQGKRQKLWGKKFKKYNFEQFAMKLLEQGDDPFSTKSGPFAKSDYASALTRWLQVFHPSQFTIVPMLYTVGEGKLHEDLWTQLNLELPQSLPDQDLHMNKHEHPKLEDDINPENLEKLTEHVNRRTGSNVLASQLKGTGVNLYGCTDCEEEEQISAWLEKNWG